jgi:cbb3-type cytochrome oxidase subunit 3
MVQAIRDQWFIVVAVVVLVGLIVWLWATRAKRSS